MKEINLSGLDLKRWNILTGTTKQHHGTKTIRFSCQAKIDETRTGQKLLAKLVSPSNLIKWNGSFYKGEMAIYGYEKNGGCSLVNSVSIEDYLKTLLSREMNGKWPIEALKAQAVAARTYAFYKMKKRDLRLKSGNAILPYDLENSEKYQVSGHLYDETSNTVRAVRETIGDILLTNDGEKLTPTFYHSKCGGSTVSPEVVWGNKVLGIVGVECPYCEKHGRQDWDANLQKKEFGDYLKLILKKYYQFEMTDSTHFTLGEDHHQSTDIKIKIRNKEILVQKIYFRRILGRKMIPGHLFKIINKGELVQIIGKGNGHGVGLCQFGTLDMSQRGIDYKKILGYYFPNHKLKKVYQEEI